MLVVEEIFSRSYYDLLFYFLFSQLSSTIRTCSLCTFDDH